MPEYRNPRTVAVRLQGIMAIESGPLGVKPRTGCLIVERADGGMALPGGWIETDRDQSAETASARETREETGISVDGGQLSWSAITPDGILLIFVHSRYILSRELLAGFVPNDEIVRLDVAWEPMELKYPLHTEALRRWFARHD